MSNKPESKILIVVAYGDLPLVRQQLRIKKKELKNVRLLLQHVQQAVEGQNIEVARAMTDEQKRRARKNYASASGKCETVQAHESRLTDQIFELKLLIRRLKDKGQGG